MDSDQKRIGIAFSGGGIRATIFHLGVLKWMAEKGMLEDIARISSVSGASLCIGLIYSYSNRAWPTSKQYLTGVLPKIQKTILENDIQIAALIRLAISPWWWNKKVNLLAKIMQEKWGISGNFSELQDSPTWYINCTTFESGKRFIFSKKAMGDYRVGYVRNPEFALADAMASSAGFPILIGPYKLRTDTYSWVKSAKYGREWVGSKNKFLHLWDGGVYDNLGLESVYKMDDGGCLVKDINYLIVSNASGGSGYKKRKYGLSAGNLKRLLEISMDQVGALRNRSVVDYIERNKNGLYFNIGNSAEKITKYSRISSKTKEDLIAHCMSEADAVKVRNYPTTLRTPSKTDFELILQHGYEVAKCTYISHESVETGLLSNEKA